jgi:hypothetical protein
MTSSPQTNNNNRKTKTKKPLEFCCENHEKCNIDGKLYQYRHHKNVYTINNIFVYIIRSCISTVYYIVNDIRRKKYDEGFSNPPV